MKHLFIDDHIIERIDNLVRKLHQPEKVGAVLRPEYRWENIRARSTCAPMWDASEKIYKMVYQAIGEPVDMTISDLLMDTGSAPKRSQSFYCYAISKNGINWEKPFLKLHEYEGVSWDGKPISRNNNIIPGGVGAVQDPNDPDPSRRYKGQLHSDDTRSKSKKFAVSPDLIHWEWLDIPSIPKGGHSTFTYDEERELFIITVKLRGPYGRAVYLTTSRDYEEWTEAELIFHADELDQENGKERIEKFFQDPLYKNPFANSPEEYKTDVYELPVFPYEGLYLGMPTMFHHSGKRMPMYENVDGRKTIELVSSRNLRNWDRVCNRAAFLELSPIGDGSAYDTAQIRPHNQPIIRNNEIWFYYGADKYRDISQASAWNREYLDSSATCLAKLRIDGFVSLSGGIEFGSVLTKPILIEGEKLVINVNSWRGQITAELIDASDGKPIDGFTNDESIPISIDSTDETMRWKNKASLSELHGRKVRICFSLFKAELFAFWFDG